MDFDLTHLIQLWSAKRSALFETDPATLSRGLVLKRIGPGRDKWGRPIELVLVQVVKPKEHHKKKDEVIWEIPTDEQLKRLDNGVLSRADLLRLWYNAPGRNSVLDPKTLRRMKMKCPNCGGRKFDPMLNNYDECANCGWIVCRQCSGTGAVDTAFSGSDPSCPFCDGEGAFNPNEEKLKATDWLKRPEYVGIVILDPDGWDRVDFEKSWTEEITQDEFDRRLAASTIQNTRNSL